MGGTVIHNPGGLRVTENSQMSASVLLSKVYEDLKCDAERENFHRLCEDYVRWVNVRCGSQSPVLIKSASGTGYEAMGLS